MRLQPTLFRRSNAQLPQGPIREPERGEAGAEAETWVAEILGGGPDVNPELTGSAKFAVYDEMRKTDPTVKSILWIPTLTIRGANWGLNPRDEREPLDKLIRDFVAANLGLEEEDGWLDLSWPKLCEQALQLLVWGAMLEELLWGDVRTWRDADGDEHLVRPLARLAPRLPATVQKFERNPDGSIKRVTQSLSGTSPIPGDKLTYMVGESEAGRWDGVSLLRPAWGAWTIKKALLISAGIGWDRFAMGIPVLYHPDNPADEEKAKKIGRNVRSHERAYVHFPVPAGFSRDEAEWGLEILNAATTLADPSPLIRLLSEQIAEAGLQHFMRQGLGQTGARATAEAQANPFYMACEAIAQDLRRDRMRQVVHKLVEVNFGREAAEDRCPILSVSRIVPRDLEAISRALSYLSAAGFTFTDRGALDDIRELLAFPRLPGGDLAEAGIDPARLREILNGLGLGSETFARIVQALPEDMGIARNRLPAEGGPLPIGT
ncbi:MAG TPA: hypothetical protein VI540_07100 [Gaiellaceae bacterium]|nr:hypothetical protein [Gaiellaceae bacterium]